MVVPTVATTMHGWLWILAGLAAALGALAVGAVVMWVLAYSD